MVVSARTKLEGSCGFRSMSFLGKHGIFIYFNDCINVTRETMACDKRSNIHSVTGELVKGLCDDGALFRRIASGDEGAFEQIFKQYRSRLLSYFTRITKCTEEAEGLTQEIFMKLWISRESLAGIESPQHYIFVIARNKAIDFLRRAALDTRLRQRIWETVRGYQESGEEEFFSRDSSRLIDEAIYKLSNRKQAVFRLSRIEGLTHDQIATRLNISKNTVKNHIVSSLKFIKNYLIER